VESLEQEYNELATDVVVVLAKKLQRASALIR
jgi:hypothetical protein